MPPSPSRSISSAVSASAARSSASLEASSLSRRSSSRCSQYAVTSSVPGWAPRADRVCGGAPARWCKRTGALVTSHHSTMRAPASETASLSYAATPPPCRGDLHWQEAADQVLVEVAATPVFMRVCRERCSPQEGSRSERNSGSASGSPSPRLRGRRRSSPSARPCRAGDGRFWSPFGSRRAPYCLTRESRGECVTPGQRRLRTTDRQAGRDLRARRKLAVRGTSRS